MKRFLSWLVLVVVSYICLVLVDVIKQVVLAVIFKIASSGVAIVILILLGGGGGLSIVGIAMMMMAVFDVSLSDLICKSEKGTRYKVVGWIMVAVYGVIMLLALLGKVAIKGSALSFYAGYIMYVLFGFFIIGVGLSDSRMFSKNKA